MRKRMLNINEVEVTEKPVMFTCHGLGSCVGLFVTDREKGLSGGAHIPMPSSNSSGEFLDATHLINKLLNDFSAMGSNLNYLRAKVTGGAQIYEGSLNIGEQNVQAVIQQLIDKKIFIAATDVGGRVSRTARFNGMTGELQISTSELKTYCI